MNRTYVKTGLVAVLAMVLLMSPVCAQAGNLGHDPMYPALPQKESRLINVTMDIPSGFEVGDHSGSILITGFPGASTGLGIGVSVRIPVEFSVEKKPASLRTLGFAIIGCVCLMIALLVYSRRSK